MNTVQTSAKSQWVMPIIIIATTTALVILFLVDPTSVNFLPRCPLNAMTGLHCPGCGATRALHQLTHGNFAMAFGLNPLLILTLCALAAFGVVRLISQKTGRPLPRVFAAPIWPWLLLALIVTFSVLRNIPLQMFEWMRP